MSADAKAPEGVGETFVIQTDDGEVSKTGKIIGHFGIDRRDHSYCESLWTVTHLPTGRQLSNVYADFLCQGDAVCAVNQLMEIEGVDWGTLMPKKDGHRDLIAIVRYICLQNNGECGFSYEGKYKTNAPKLNGYSSPHPERKPAKGGTK